MVVKDSQMDIVMIKLVEILKYPHIINSSMAGPYTTIFF